MHFALFLFFIIIIIITLIPVLRCWYKTEREE